MTEYSIFLFMNTLFCAKVIKKNAHGGVDMGLRELPIKISYRSKGDDNILDGFIIPAFNVSTVYKRSVGFFSSSVFELIGEGVRTFVEHGGTIQLICSPDLSSDDIEAIKLGYQLKDAILHNAFVEDLDATLERLDDMNLLFLVEIIKNNKLNIKLVDVENKYGIYHDKIGIFIDSVGDRVLFVGSPNESKSAYSDNYEKIRLSMSWKEGDRERILDDEEEFDGIWEGHNCYITSKEITEAVCRKLQEKIKKRNLEIEEKEPIVLRDYQNQAINAWIQNDKTGFYIMATGTGKTWTAIYSAKKVMDEEKIMLVICAPYKHLIKQWKEDVEKVFPDNPIVMVSSENPTWQDELMDAVLFAKYGTGKSVIAISTIKSFNSEKFDKIAKKTNMKRMLIVDEAHRFKNLSDDIKRLYPYMLGLSATPSSRKNDEFGQQLVEFFGGEVFNLPIEYAIEKGYLIKYNYYPIYVDATCEDERKFDFYTKLMSSCFKNNVCIDMEGLAKHKRARLRVISMAENKITKIDWILSQVTEQDHFIVYCGDGRLYESDASEGVRHIQFIKDILTERGFKVCQFTANESMDERMKIVESFNKGMIDTMVAIRCLDEGINIPSIEGALLLSSNDDYREFVQRRGRILRTYYNSYTGCEKEIANIYDVIVLPSDYSNNFAAIELRRFYEYARLAENKKDCMREFDDLLIRYGLELEELINVEDMEVELDE